jgi:hypothetical protein
MTNVKLNQSMLTTEDNPFDPFTQFDEWYAFDVEKEYYTCAYLARIAKTSDELSEADEDLAIEDAIDEIVKLNILGIYKKVSRAEKKT